MNFKSYMDDEIRRKKEVIPGTFDAVFKSLFIKIPELLIEVVTGIEESITKEDMKNCKIISNEYPKENINEKGKISDLVIEVENKIINIEMNKKYYEKIIKRNNAYLNKIQSLDEEKIVIGINIDNYNLYDNKTSIIKFQMMSESKIVDKTFLTKYHVNLEAINKKYYNKEKLTRTEKVLLMLKKKEREELKKISRGDELMEKMYEELCKMSEDKNSILSYSKEELELEAEKIEAREIGHAEGHKEGHKEGYKEGKIEGMKEGMKETAKKLLNMNMKIEDISKATGLSVREIEKLR